MHQYFVSVLSCLTFLGHSTHLELKNMQADFLWLCRNKMEVFSPSSAEGSGAALPKIFTSTYDNFIQTAGIRDGASHCAKIPGFLR
jgi:hypothetical protein